MFSRILALGALLLAVGRSQYAYCDDEDECANQEVTGLYVYCRGYQGCYYSDVTATYYSYCYGYQGCYGATVDSGYYTYCDGMYGCAYGTVTAGYSSYCYGRYGCYQSDISASSSGIGCYSYGSCQYANLIESSYTYCHGYYGCAYSSIMKTTRVYAYAFYSLYSTDIVAASDEYLYIYAYGYFATRYTDVWCYSGSSCYVYCDGYGCYDIDLYCYDGANCYVSCSDDCDYCADIIDASNITQNAQFDTLYKNKNLVKTEMKNKLKNEQTKFESKGKDVVKNEKEWEEIKTNIEKSYIPTFEAQNHGKIRKEPNIDEEKILKESVINYNANIGTGIKYNGYEASLYQIISISCIIAGIIGVIVGLVVSKYCCKSEYKALA